MLQKQCEKVKKEKKWNWWNLRGNKDALETNGKDPKDLQKIWEVERLLSEILYISSEDYENYLLSQNTEEAIHFIGK